MKIDEFVLSSYPKVSPYAGVNSIEDVLLIKKYLIAIENNEFFGILTPSDLIIRPKKIVIDCISPKEKLLLGDSVIHALDILLKDNSPALPVFNDDEFIGILDEEYLIENLKLEVLDLYEQSKISYNLKDSFLKYLSHEIRTPLNSILGFIEIISCIETNELNNKEYLNAIKVNSEQFILTMDDLIDFSRVYSGDKIVIQNERIDIEKVFSDIKYFLENKIYTSEGLRIKIDYEIYSDKKIIRSDGKKLTQILYHLALTLLYRFSCMNITFIYSPRKNLTEFIITGLNAVVNKKKKKIMDSILKDEDESNSINIYDIGTIELQTIRKIIRLLNGNIHLVVEEDNIMFKLVIPIFIEEKSELNIS